MVLKYRDDPVNLRSHRIVAGELPPPAPRVCFGRDELVARIADFAEGFTPITHWRRWNREDIHSSGCLYDGLGITVGSFDATSLRLRVQTFSTDSQKVIGAGVENPKHLTSLPPSLDSQGDDHSARQRRIHP